MEFLSNYGLFLAKTITVVVAIVAIVVVIFSLRSKGAKDEDENLEVIKLNDRYKALRHKLQQHILAKDELKELEKDEKKQQKIEKRKGEQKSLPRLFVLDFDGDIRASAVTALRKEITAILTLATPNDQVFLRLESAGGLVHAYGLAASQLERLRRQNIPLTIAVDKVAASGGYMMACVADRIVAAPFAVIGSIGVVAQIPNFHRLLKKNNIDFEQITAGEFKRTLTLFGENTETARSKFKQEVEETHKLFKDFISQHRPKIDIERIATGEHWHGLQALDLQLVDSLITSDDYLMEASRTHDIYEIRTPAKRSFGEKISSFFGGAVTKLEDVWLDRSHHDRLLP